MEQNVDGGFVALVPRIPGCISQGEARADALENITDAIKAMLDVLGEDNIDLNDYSPVGAVELTSVAI